MKKFYVDFSGWCEIEADNEEQAKNEFWRLIGENLPLPYNFYQVDRVYNVSQLDGIEREVD